MELLWDEAQPERFAFKTPLIAGRFIERPNRFVAYVDLNGEVVKTHVPDPGRLKELLLPDVAVMLTDYGELAGRKTRYALSLVKSPDSSRWVSLNTQLPNRLVCQLLKQNRLTGLEDYRLVKTEFTYGKSRFDFLLENTQTGRKRLLEVKSVTLVDDNKTALFPDAPTVRGTRHLRELMAAMAEGIEAGVLFVVQRDDACRVRPNAVTDPDFAQAVVEAMASGVSFSAIACRMMPEGILVQPVVLPVESVV